MHLRTFAAALCLFLLLSVSAQAQPPVLRGYDQENDRYQYVTFGRYPTDANDAEAPMLWRVLGPGLPGEGDVVNSTNVPNRKAKKTANEDGDCGDVFCLITEHVIDMVFYHDVRDVAGGPGLDYVDTMMHATLNSEIINRLFTAEEQAVLVEMPERGLLGLPSRKGELYRSDYGFVPEEFAKWPRRSTTGTPYAFSQGLKRIDGHSWYWTADWRAAGRRWIVGDDGHISVSGVDREGGIRPVCYIHTEQLELLGGDGTKKNPYQLAARQTN